MVLLQYLMVIEFVLCQGLSWLFWFLQSSGLTHAVKIQLCVHTEVLSFVYFSGSLSSNWYLMADLRNLSIKKGLDAIYCPDSESPDRAVVVCAAVMLCCVV